MTVLAKHRSLPFGWLVYSSQIEDIFRPAFGAVISRHCFNIVNLCVDVKPGHLDEGRRCSSVTSVGSAPAKFNCHRHVTGMISLISVAGGAKGERRFPLMAAPHNWDILSGRMLQLIAESGTDSEVANVLGSVRSSLDSARDLAEVQSRLQNLLAACCEAARRRWDGSGQAVAHNALKEYFDCTLRIVPPLAMPSLYVTLLTKQNELDSALASVEEGYALEEDAIADWVSVLKLVADTDRRILIQDGFPERYKQRIERLCKAIKFVMGNPTTDGDELECEARYMRSFSSALDELQGLIPEVDDLIGDTSREASAQSDEYEERKREGEPSSEERDSPSEYRTATSPTMNLERLFSDL